MTDTVAPGVSPLRRAIIVAAVELTTESGWPAVTMARLADTVGVSRQTVYNEIGSKAALADAMVLEELTRFLSIIDECFARHPGDLLESVRDTVRGILELARDNKLLHAIVTATHGSGTELLPPLTTRADSLRAAARTVIVARIAPFALPFTDEQLDAMIDLLVRVVLSHVMQPSDTPTRTADDITWVVGRVLNA